VDRERAGAYSALVTVQLLFATLPVAMKFGLEELHPTVFVGMRVAAGALLLFGLERLVHAHPLPDVGDLGRLAVYAMFGVVLNMVLYVWGLDLSTAVNAALLMTMIPVFTYAIALLAGQEAFQPARALGILVALAGVVVLLDPRSFSLGDDDVLGTLLILVNTLSYAIYLVISRPILARVPPLTTISWIFAFGALVIVPLGWWQAGTQAFLVSGRSALILSYIVIGPTVTVYALNLWALKRVASSTVAVFIYLQPIAGVALAWWLLGEPVDLRTFVAGALVFAGVALVTLFGSEEGRRLDDEAEA
jgi:drug/metabolite transporter (DMT)-like permease